MRILASVPVILVICVLAVILLALIIYAVVTIVKNKKNKSLNNSTANNGNNQPVYNEQAAPYKGNGHVFLKLLIAIILVGALIFGVLKIVDCAKNPTNSDGTGELMSRSARYSDLTITQSDEFTLTDKYNLVPHTDIDSLEITIHFSDSSQKLVKTKTKYIGNVVKDGLYTFSFSYSDFSIQEITKIKYWRYEVTGGTVSYFK